MESEILARLLEAHPELVGVDLINYPDEIINQIPDSELLYLAGIQYMIIKDW